ncbi:MAG: SDR family oxidoreductase [Muribaculum sp.]|nr:SDR family oxidoreductase [Muribaculum sp.]
MADNYLEKKMEEHLSGRRPAYRPKTTPTGSKPGSLCFKFPTRRVFVTGGASGIGASIVKAFCNAGCRVAFCDIDNKVGHKTAQDTGSQFYPLDVADSDGLESCLDRILSTWGDIDIIVNNVGVSRFISLTETTVEDFDKILAINLRPVFITSRRLAIHRSRMSETNDYGRIINICSTRFRQSEPGTEAYSASKGAIMSLTHSLMASLAPLRITVNSISPGWIATSGYDTLRPEDHSQHPSGRVGRPDDIARMCLFLSMPDNDFINGENIVVDGGMTRKMIYVE